MGSVKAEIVRNLAGQPIRNISCIQVYETSRRIGLRKSGSRIIFNTRLVSVAVDSEDETVLEELKPSENFDRVIKSSAESVKEPETPLMTEAGIFTENLWPSFKDNRIISCDNCQGRGVVVETHKTTIGVMSQDVIDEPISKLKYPGIA
ncbi:hypothetical protein Tco_0652331 [Tanacetum coccineum]|uniref:Uncharacterized protein n=1 Tax=Tanacetum coccineum TaxID=301880 RepID=A0ABQ4WXD0_9ASTR